MAQTLSHQEHLSIKEADLKTLSDLIAQTRGIVMTPQQEAEQRRSFAYGNCKIENDLITREMVAGADEKLFPLK